MAEISETAPEPGLETLLSTTAERLRARFTKAPKMVYCDWIKPNFRFSVREESAEEYSGSQEDRLRRSIPVGAVVETERKQIYFIYASLYALDQQADGLALAGSNILTMYFHVSLEVFCRAERMYQKNKDLGWVDDFLSL